MSLLGIGQSLWETVSNLNNVRRMAKYECKVKVFRRKINILNQIINRKKKNETFFETLEVSSENLVPGDIM